MKMNIRFSIFTIIVMGLLLFTSYSCDYIWLNKDIKPPVTVTDIDGNVYHTITIGTQVWMLENLKTTKYRNGDPIPYVTGNTQWSNLTGGAYCWYNNNLSNKNKFGALYNWYAVNDNRNIAPIGWHVPTLAEFNILVEYLGGASLAGGKLKTTGTIEGGDGLWASPNSGATNESGFTGLPGGHRTGGGGFEFTNPGLFGNWWSTTEFDYTDPRAANRAWMMGLYTELSGLYLGPGGSYHALIYDGYGNIRYGMSVRCIKDYQP